MSAPVRACASLPIFAGSDGRRRPTSASVASTSGRSPAPPPASPPPTAQLHRRAAAVLAAATLLVASPRVAAADTLIEGGLTPDQAVAAARPLPGGDVDTTRVWLLLGGSAVGLFGAALTLGESSLWSPARSLSFSASFTPSCPWPLPSVLPTDRPPSRP